MDVPQFALLVIMIVSLVWNVWLISRGQDYLPYTRRRRARAAVTEGIVVAGVWTIGAFVIENMPLVAFWNGIKVGTAWGIVSFYSKSKLEKGEIADPQPDYDHYPMP